MNSGCDREGVATALRSPALMRGAGSWACGARGSMGELSVEIEERGCVQLGSANAVYIEGEGKRVALGGYQYEFQFALCFLDENRELEKC